MPSECRLLVLTAHLASLDASSAPAGITVEHGAIHDTCVMLTRLQVSCCTKVVACHVVCGLLHWCVLKRGIAVECVMN